MLHLNFFLKIHPFLMLVIIGQLHSVKAQDATLRQLFIIFRHGDRNPVNLYPNDPNSEADFPDGFGELTNVGKNEQFEMGKFLRTRYAKFLTDDPREAQVNSSNVNRCLDSVEANLAGLYPPNGRHIWNKDFNWQPIPIHTRLEEEDNILTLDPKCPEYDKEMTRIFKTPDVQKYLKELEPLFEYMTNNTGEKIHTITSASYIFDTLQIEKWKGLKVPSWSDSIWNQMKDVQNFSFYIRFSTTLAKRLKGGPILKDIVNKMIDKARNKNSVPQKVFIYSTHDTDVTALMSAMSVYNKIPPPYCATVLMELHEKGPRNHTIRMMYENGTDGPFPLVVPGCEEDCPLGHFIRLTKDSIPDDWARECGLQEEEIPFSSQALTVIGAMGIVLILLVFSTGVMLWLRCQKEKSGVRYSRVPEDALIN